MSSYRTISVLEETKKKFDSAYYAAKSIHTGDSELSMDSFLAKLLKDKKKMLTKAEKIQNDFLKPEVVKAAKTNFSHVQHP